MREKKRGKGRGFTFLELMIVLSLSVIVFTVIIPGYNRFRRRQAAVNAAMDFKYKVRKAIQLASETEDVYAMTVNWDQDTVSIESTYNPVNPKVICSNYSYSQHYFGTNIGGYSYGNPTGTLNFYPGGGIDGSLEHHTPPDGSPMYYYVDFINGNTCVQIGMAGGNLMTFTVTDY